MGLWRRGLIKIEDFYYKFRSGKFTSNYIRMAKIPETFLATATNGEVFLDNLGDFSNIRKIY